MVMLDLDDQLSFRLPTGSELQKVIKHSSKDWMALTAVTPCYYDSWALRSSWCSKDWVHDCKTPQEVRDLKKKVRVKYSPNQSPLSVDSAFNGFAIYKAKLLSNVLYSAWDVSKNREICEHVTFHQSLRDLNPKHKIYLCPQLRLGRNVHLLVLSFFQKQIKKD